MTRCRSRERFSYPSVCFTDSAPITIPSAFGAQPIALDATGDMRVDLLGYTSKAKDKMSLWKNAYARTNQTQLFEMYVAKIITALDA